MLTMSISTGLYPTLYLWNANKLHYIPSLTARKVSTPPTTELTIQHSLLPVPSIYYPCN